MNRISVWFLALSLIFFSCNSSNHQISEKYSPIPVIFDTDFGPDYDDVGAITLLHAFADSGYIDILATIGSCTDTLIGPALDVMNTYFGKPDIPIAVTRTGIFQPCAQKWNDSIVAYYPHSITSDKEVPEAVELYREILSKQEDNSVTIITVGFLTNLSDLLNSKPDKHNELSGKELIALKVRLLVSMAGTIPSGREFNVVKDSLKSKHAIDNWPTPIIFSGFEIGKEIITGVPLISNANINNSPVKDAFRIAMPYWGDMDGRMSWDQTAVLIAAKGCEPYFSTVSGKFITFDDGHNEWKDDINGTHKYVTFNMSIEDITKTIDYLMMHQPVGDRND